MTSMVPIRVLHLGSPAGLYGAERWILALTRYLDPAVVHSTVGVILDGDETVSPLLTEAGKLGADTVSVEARGRLNLKAVQRLREILVSRRVDILHTHFYKTDLIGLLAARGTTCRTVTTPHGWSVNAGLALRIYESLDRAAFRFFDAVAPLSPELHAELAGRARSVRYIANGVDIGEIDASTELAPEGKRWRNAGEIVVGYVGQLISRKGIDTLLRAFAAAALPRGRLVLVGDGEQRQELQQLAISLGLGERVEFLGYRKDRLALMRGFDLFALPSHLEGIPRCLMEAMAAHVPIIASDIPGCRDLIVHDHTGLLFPVNDAEALKSAIERLRNPVDRQRLATAARTRVENEFSADAMARAYTGLYQELLGRDPELTRACALPSAGS